MRRRTRSSAMRLGLLIAGGVFAIAAPACAAGSSAAKAENHRAKAEIFSDSGVRSESETSDSQSLCTGATSAREGGGRGELCEKSAAASGGHDSGAASPAGVREHTASPPKAEASETEAAPRQAQRLPGSKIPLSLSDRNALPVHLSQSIKFSAGQEGFRSGTPKDGMICAAAVASWSEFLGTIDEILKVPPLMLPVAELAEISAALEQEISLCEAHYGPLPPWLPVAVQARLLGIERKLQARREALSREAASAQKRRKSRRTPREIAAEWQWPLPHPVVTSDFGPRSDPFSGRRRMHNGVDLRAREPQRVEAIGPGTVTRSGENGGHGISVEVLHEGGFTSVYSHLSLALMAPGDRVEKGDAVGISGNTGRSTAPHLHFELWLGGTPVNPLKYLKEEPEFGCEDWVTPEGTVHVCGGNAK